MTWTVTPFRAADYLDVTAALGRLEVGDPEGTAEAFARGGPAFTGRWNGRPVACAGLVESWPGLATAWALLGPEAVHHGGRIHRSVKQWLSINSPRYRRIEAAVMEEHAAGIRWVRHLDFELESVMERYGPAGETCLRVVLFPGEKP